MVEIRVYYYRDNIPGFFCGISQTFFKHSFVGIQNKDIDGVYSFEGIGHGVSRVACRSQEHVEFPVFGILDREIFAELGQKSCAHILERLCWTVEEFECISVISHIHKRYRKIECGANYRIDKRWLDIRAEKLSAHHIGDVAGTHLVHVFEKSRRNQGDAAWHVDTSVRGKTAHYRFAQAHFRIMSVSAVIFHRVQ